MKNSIRKKIEFFSSQGLMKLRMKIEHECILLRFLAIAMVNISCGVLASISASTVAYAHSFEGAWDWNGAPSTKAFSIELTQRGNVLQGQYCAIARNGNRVDCDNERMPNIDGVVDRAGKSAEINFSSFFGGEGGKAKIRIQNDKLIWHVTKNPENGEFFAPIDAILDRH
ncbi:hypothetical protein G3O01_01390 [Burkholderia sp. Ac-20365]|nr:hypothetical protein [Burkholderia sp. Ac-20365]